ncbi:MAG: helix-turn-helix transcriptional regulator [Acidobacteriota bacterium]
MMRPPAEFERAVLLSLIRLGDNAYGVTIRAELEKLLGRSVSFGAVYTTLDRLEGKGFAASSLGDPTPQRGGRAKKFFRITREGSKALEQAKAASRAIWNIARVRGAR